LALLRDDSKTSLAGPEADRAREALSHYNGAIEQLKSGNWEKRRMVGYGKLQE
jgi:hypothetical protein